MRYFLLLIVFVSSHLASAEEELVKVWVRSEPIGAEIFLSVQKEDGKPDLRSIGKTPELINLPLGKAAIVLRLSKYKDSVLPLVITGKSILKPDIVKLELLTNSVDVIWMEDGWEISLDKQPYLKNEKPVSAPATLDLINGKHEITLNKDGYESITTVVEVKDAPATLDLTKTVPKKSVKPLARVTASGPTDVLSLFNLKDAASVKGDWQLANGVLTSPVEPYARVTAKFSPPDEYIINVAIERVRGDNDFVIGLSLEDKQFAVDIDAYGSTICGIDSIGGKRCDENVTRLKGKPVITTKTTTLTIAVRKTEIVVSSGARKLISWKPEIEKLSLPAEWATTQKEMQKDALFVGAWNTSFKITKLEVEPIK